MQTIIFATQNAGKVREIKDMLHPRYDVLTMREAGVELSIEETGTTFLDNALIKARSVSDALAEKGQDSIVIADDSGIEIDFFDRKPGIYSSRWLGEDTPYEIKNQIVLDRMKEVPDDKRTARYVCALVAVVPARLIPGDFPAAAKAQELSVVETVEGLIANEPKGNGGFGYDPIFLIPEAGQTFAEMTAEEKHAISHRGKALRALIQLFQSHHLLD